MFTETRRSFAMQFADTGVGKIYADLYGTGSFEITCVIVTATIHVIETSMRTNGHE